ncbi:MAG: hypothetical protein SFW67_18930 [Myxococcaceae bacterium]|nr:hypothetical protein [Myxococcaceae bacterium]
MSRDDNDALERAQRQALDVAERVTEMEAELAGLRLQRERLSLRLQGAKRRRDQVRALLDARPGSGILSVIGLCAGGVVARLGWELRPHLVPDERALLAGVALASAVALTISRTHWFRAGLGR